MALTNGCEYVVHLERADRARIVLFVGKSVKMEMGIEKIIKEVQT